MATFTGQLYFQRSYFFTLRQSNYFDTTVTFLEQLFLHSICFFLTSSFFRMFRSIKQTDLAYFYRENNSNLKNHCHETFLAYFWLALKRHNVMFYSLICITKLNYLLGMQSNIKKFLHFFSSSVRMGGKSIIFNDKKTKKKKKKIIKAKGYLI